MQIRNRAILAPMSEYTTAPFRKLCKKYGADYAIVPLVSATAIARNPEYTERVDFNPEFDDCIQLFGAHPADFKAALKVLTEKFPGLKWVDINCGCPSYKVCDPGAGSALLSAPETVAGIARQMRGDIQVLSIKMRLAEVPGKTMAFAKAVAAEGVDFITVHGRTPRQGYAGKSNWDMIRKLKENVGVPVVGNGDLLNKKEGEARVRDGYCDAFMIGRAAMGNPRCFSNLEISGKGDGIAVMMEYIRICDEMGLANLNDLKAKALQFFRNFSGSSRMRGEIGKCKSIDELLAVCNRIL